MKMILGLLLAAQLWTGPTVAVGMIESDIPVVEAEYVAKGDEPTRQEEFMWFYRVVNGKEQMRLWSVTYGRWVTDWIDCD